MAKKQSKTEEKVQETFISPVKKFLRDHFGKTLVGFLILFAVAHFYGEDKKDQVQQILEEEVVGDSIVKDGVVVDTSDLDTL